MAAAKSAASLAATTAKGLLRAAERPSKLPSTKLTTASGDYKLDLLDHCFYYDTLAPTEQQLKHSAEFFKASNHSPIQMWTASEFRTVPMSDVPEVAFLGRSNAGKSSLLNAIMSKDLCYTSSKLGRTRTLNAYGIGGQKGGEAKVVVVDTPGYGKGSTEEWGAEIIKYLTQRKQLRRAFILINSHHGIKAADASLLSLLRTHAVPHQILLSKADSLLVKGGIGKPRGLRPERLDDLSTFAEKIRQRVQPVRNAGGVGAGKMARKERRRLAKEAELRAKAGIETEVEAEMAEPGVPALGEILACSMKMKVGDRFLGVDAIRWSILRAAGLGG
ncbi:ribosome biogenesis GTP-binding protein YsxC [Blastomyces parvus]|uniref:Ribosome biogenesis GTP-binding protein YsxC n=1 Tax=Blastomyces parvus TaxID=2060905 RepID=A0A2B7WN12_9EURO|nr:ribosome biogenesis GTP-binding protein YsxC [Blastomyces parvus]